MYSWISNDTIPVLTGELLWVGSSFCASIALRKYQYSPDVELVIRILASVSRFTVRPLWPIFGALTIFGAPYILYWVSCRAFWNCHAQSSGTWLDVWRHIDGRNSGIHSNPHNWRDVNAAASLTHMYTNRWGTFPTRWKCAIEHVVTPWQAMT